MPKLKQFVRKAVRRAGFDIVSMANKSDRVFNALWALLPEIDVVFDVGANLGQFRDQLRDELGFKGRILSFEPSPQPFEECRRRAEVDPLWDVFPWAIGSETGTLPLNLAMNSDMSSFRQVANPHNPWKSARVQGTIEVPVRRLDEVVAELGIGPDQRILIKADTQGFDLEVFRGAPDTVARSRALLSEVAQIHIYDGAPSFVDAISEMRGYGFDVAALSPITSVGWAVVEWDCLLVRRTLDA